MRQQCQLMIPFEGNARASESVKADDHASDVSRSTWQLDSLKR